MKQVFLTFVLLLSSLFSGCGDDLYPLYAEVDNEEIVKELTDQPAYVVGWVKIHQNRMMEREFDPHVKICYSQYADEYYASTQRDTFPEVIKNDVGRHNIGISYILLRKKDLKFNDKVYVTASVTNNNVLNVGYTSIPVTLDMWSDVDAYKAYWHEIRKR